MTAAPPGPALSAREVTRTYPGGATACQTVTLDVFPGEMVVLRGRSGAGKTTLLNLLGRLDRPTSGQVLLDGRDMNTISEREMTTIRQSSIGYAFQNFGLLPMLSAAENVELPLRVQKVGAVERRRRVTDALAMVGLSRHARQRPDELSGGQQQRVALARAIVKQPRILIADEPTAQLDSATARKVIDLIAHLVVNNGVAAIISTHQEALAARATRLLTMRDGRVGTAQGSVDR